MNRLTTILVVGAFMCFSSNVHATAPSTRTEKSADFSTSDNLSEAALTERLYSLDIPFSFRYTPEVRSYIRRHVVDGVRETEQLLGRTSIYFSVFEHYLRLYNLPDALKYLPLVESGLQTRVTSHKGASGLWQFVPATARRYGLQQDGQIDERLNTYEATEAAVKMLANLYQQFGDWGLVLAAYNAGPGRVQQAVRRAGCADYWEVRRYLPTESQKYVPAFLAAAYLVNFHSMHGIQPNFPDFDRQNTRAFRVYNTLSLAAVARAIGVGHQTLRALNPGFLTGVVPRSEQGHYVVVPARVAGDFMARYGHRQGEESLPSNRVKSTYVAVPGDRIHTLALLFRCSVEDIMRWNGLNKAEVVANQHLVVYMPMDKVRP
jgi:membrane-bound lytic murein transglycosylase D